MNTYKTDFLVSTGSFLIGAGSVMNIYGNYFQYNYSKDGEEADRLSLYRDWRMVGQDIEEANRSGSETLLASG